MNTSDVWKLTARDVVELLKEKKVTPAQLVEVCQRRWQATEPALCAMPITAWQQAQEQAQRPTATAHLPACYLHGLPVAIKDLTAAKGLLFTQGSPLFRARVADHSDPLVDLLEAHGAVVVGKTNTPELGAGSQTYNNVFGTTRNPWDVTKTAGGSSGGAAAALAAGQVWLATGTDLGGSLRNPAAFCGVVGLRPTSGVVPERRGAGGSSHPAAARLHSVSGPMARNVGDLALLLDAMSGTHPADPLARPAPRVAYSAAVLQPPRRLRHIAFSADLGGVSAVDREIAAACRAAAHWLGGLGATVADSCPIDFADAPQVFYTLRALHFREHGALAREPLRSMVKPELVWQVEQGLSLTDKQIEWAEAGHDALRASATAFFEHHDLLVCPAAMMPPFGAEVTWPREFEGATFPDYIAWMMLACVISLLDAPAICVPCGLTTAGLPIGVQLVAAPHQEAFLLQVAAAYEQAHPWAAMVPRDPA